MYKEYLILFSALICLVLGLVVYQKNSKSPVNKSFFLFTVIVFIWSVVLFFYTHPIFFSALTWIKITYFVGIFNAPALFYFCAIFGNRSSKNIFWPILIYFILFFPIVWILFSTNLFVKEVILHPWGYGTTLGSIYLFYGGLEGVFASWGFVILVNKYLKSSGLEKFGTLYILIGIILFSIPSFYVDIILPLIANVSKYFWISPIFSLFFIGFTAFAITRHHLFGIKVILTESLVAFMGIVLLIQVLAANTLQSRLSGLGIFTLFLVVGYILLKSTYKDIKRGEELQQINERLEKANERIRELNHMKDDFIPIATKELNMPLMAIKNYLWMLKEGKDFGNLNGAEKSRLNEITKLTEKLTPLLSEFSLNLEKKK